MRTLQTAPYIPTSMVRNMKKEEINESKARYQINHRFQRTLHGDREGKSYSPRENDHHYVAQFEQDYPHRDPIEHPTNHVET